MKLIEIEGDVYIGEVFKPVTYPKVKPNVYFISNFGRLYSLNKGKRKRFLYVAICEKGYEKVYLSGIKEGSRYKIPIHRLVAYEFCKGYKEGLVVNHMDGVKRNNYYTNLEWTTYSGNSLHAHQTGLIPIGNRIQARKHSEKTIHKICELLQEGLKPNDIANVLNDHIEEELSYSVIHGIARHIHNRKSWKHIAKDYVW